MKIELKSIQVFERMSEETTAFVAKLYIDGKYAGDAKNEGHGGNTDYSIAYSEDKFIRDRNHKLISEAEAYCSKLPQIDYGDFKIECSLEHYVDYLLNEHLKVKDRAKLQKKMEKSILWGNDNEYVSIAFKIPIKDVLVHPKGPDTIKTNIERLRLKYPSFRLLNNNIPAHLLS